jgi:hypothetical protein
MGEQPTRHAREYWIKKQAGKAVDRALLRPEPVVVECGHEITYVMWNYHLTAAAEHLAQAVALDRRIQEALDRRIQELKK